MAALDFVVGRLADVVQQPAAAADVAVQPDLSANMPVMNATSTLCRSTFWL